MTLALALSCQLRVDGFPTATLSRVTGHTCNSAAHIPCGLSESKVGTTCNVATVRRSPPPLAGLAMYSGLRTFMQTGSSLIRH